MLAVDPKHLFQFELAPVESIKAWRDNDGELSLNLYALTEGHFSIAVGNEVLLRYTPEIIARWQLPNQHAEYQVACFAMDMLASVSAIISPIPALFEKIVRDEALFRQLRKCSDKRSRASVPAAVIQELSVQKANNDFSEAHYRAFRWLGERTPWLNYLTESPDLWCLRVGNAVWTQWDNVDRKFEGIDVWTASRGTYVLSLEVFVAECHSFSERLLAAMGSRIRGVESGTTRPQIPIDIASLDNQLSVFKNDFEKSLCAEYEPDIDWDQAEMAIRKIALKSGVTLPPV